MKELYFIFILLLFRIGYCQSMSYEIASNIVSGLFPAYLVSDTNLAKAESWLSGAGKDAPAALRRLVSENRDAMARALKAQGVDAKA